MSESTGSRSKLICSESIVLCSGLLVSLTFGVSCQRTRPSEIRWLNVKQPTSTRSGSQVKLIMSETFVFCSSLLVSLAFEFCHRRARLCLNRRLTREFTLLESYMIYHQAEQVSQCDWAAVVKGAQHPFIGRLCTLSHCLRHGGRFRLARIIGHHARERFVGSRAARSSEIRSLNVKQPTSTQLRLNWTRLDLRLRLNGTRLDLEQDLSRGELTRTISHARDVSCPVAHLSESSSR